MATMIRMTMAAAAAGWAATWLLALLGLSRLMGGWLIVCLSLRGSLSRCDRHHTRCLYGAPGAVDDQCLAGRENKILTRPLWYRADHADKGVNPHQGRGKCRRTPGSVPPGPRPGKRPGSARPPRRAGRRPAGRPPGRPGR